MVSFAIVAPYTLRVTFDDTTTQVIDFSPILEGELYGPLRDASLFNQVQLDPEVQTLVWPNGADFDPATLHDWPEHLEELKALLSSTGGDKMVITEGIFSMDGDFSALDQICCLAKDYGATMIVDDAHGDFVFGSPGSYSGVPAYFDVKELIDINISSLSKGLGCFGGYVASSKLVRELLINRSRQFIYTSALPEHLCGAALAAIPVAVKGNLQHRLFRNVKLFYKKLTDLGFSVGRSTSQIIPVMIGAEKLAMEFANQLLLKGVFVQPIRYPTVGKGKARLRLTVTSSHAKADLLTAADTFEIVGKKNKII